MPPTAPSRRTVLCGLAAALAAPGVLAACSSGGATPAPPAAAPPPTPASPPAPAPSPAAPGTGGGTPLADIPVGGGRVVEVGDRPILLVQPTAGTVKAFDATCPHQGSTVDPPQGGVITCPNHFSQFDAATGALRKGPADRGLTEVPARVVGGTVQVT